MAVLSCGHDAPPGPRLLCRHLIEAKAEDKEQEYARWLRGRGIEYDLVCEACAKTINAGKSIERFEACAECTAFFDDPWSVTAWLGTPEVFEAPTTFDATLRVQTFPVALAGAQTVLPLGDGKVLGFVGQELQLVSLESVEALLAVALPEESNDWGEEKRPRPRLLASPNDRFIALVHDYGHYGAIVDLQTRQVTLNLDRDDYHPEQTPFPVTFFIEGGRQLLVHATHWNRLDISDPRTGELLTSRGPTSYSQGEERPEHYLNYFHGGLHVSPDGIKVLDDGWVWHPVGVPTCWNLHRWIGANYWESEDGPTRRALCHRAYHWDVPMTWIGNDKVAISGLGDDDDAMLKGARIFDVQSGEELNAFAGPSGTFFSDGVRLFSVEADGLHVWNVEKGARLGRIPNFRPAWQVGDELIEIRGCQLRAWNFDRAV